MKEFAFTNNEKKKKVLILRQDRIGDLIISSAFLKILRKNLPDTQIDILLGKNNIIAKDGISEFVDNVYFYNKSIWSTIKLIGKLKDNKYDMLIDLLDNPSRTSARFVKYVKAKSSLGFDHHEITPYTITAKLPKKSKTHPADRLLSIAHALGLIYSNEEYTYSFAFSEKSENYAQTEIADKFQGKSILGINLSGSSDSKFWGVKNTIELCKYINQKYQDIQIILFADASKSKVAIEIQDYCSAVYIPSQSLYDFAACISKCDCLISPDTSSVHLASAYHIPTLAMYEVHDKNKYGMPWLPYKVAYRSIENSGPISEIEVEKVSSAFDELWNEIIKNKKD